MNDATIGFIAVITIGINLMFFVFWLCMLIDCLKNEPPEGNNKLVWTLVIILLNLLGAVLYYFVRRQPRLHALRGGLPS